MYRLLVRPDVYCRVIPLSEDDLAPDMRVSADQASRFSHLHSSQMIGYEESIFFLYCAAAKLQQGQHEGSSSQK